MRKLWTRLGGLAISCLYVIPSQILAAGGGGGEAIVFVADSRRHTGLLAWFSNLYNESLALFALFTVVTIPLLAVTLSFFLGSLLAKTGIDLKSKAVGGH
jgi:hypothetical protein